MKNGDMPAMPQDVQFGRKYHADFDGNGLSKREYFAGLAMQGMLCHATRYRPREEDAWLHWHGAIAKESAEIADALLAELEKTK